MDITLLFTGILGIIFFVHSLRTIYARHETKISLGAGESELMLRRIRIHANFAEYVPLLLIILALLEHQGVANWLLYLYGSVVVIGRVLHPFGLYARTQPSWARIYGMQFTLWPLILGSSYLLYLALF